MTDRASRNETGRAVRLRGLREGRVVAVALAIAFVAALVHLPRTLHAINADHRELAALAPAERPLIGAYSTDIDRGFLRAAKAQIPPSATYYVLTGSRVQVSSPNTLSAVAPYLGYWLLPRTQVTDPQAADWIISYGGEAASLRLKLGRTIDVSPGLSLVEVQR